MSERPLTLLINLDVHDNGVACFLASLFASLKAILLDELGGPRPYATRTALLAQFEKAMQSTHSKEQIESEDPNPIEALVCLAIKQDQKAILEELLKLAREYIGFGQLILQFDTIEAKYRLDSLSKQLQVVKVLKTMSNTQIEGLPDSLWDPAILARDLHRIRREDNDALR